MRGARASREGRPPGGRDAVLTPLFDRFEGRSANGGSLARDLEDLLGARRPASSPDEGIIGWGIPIPPGLSPNVESHRERVAALVGDAIAKFEPRLHGVRVTPVAGAGEFLYDLDGRTHVREGSVLRLRVLVPRRDGGLGARVLELVRVPRPCPADEPEPCAGNAGERTRRDRGAN